MVDSYSRRRHGRLHYRDPAVRGASVSGLADPGGRSALERATRTARQPAEASLSQNTLRAYSGALRRLDAWLDGRPLEDATLATYLAELHDQGRAPASAATAVAAACFRARLAGGPSPAGERTAQVLAGYRRTAGDRGRGQARPFGAADLDAVIATCHQPRRRGRGRESEEVARERGRLDAVIAGLLFMGGMRRSEVSALRWADLAIAAHVDGVLVTVRRGKTNQEGETKDVRFVKGSVAHAIRMLRTFTNSAPEDRVVPLSPKMVGLRFQAAAQAAGVEYVTAHSGRVGLASELTSRGASTTDVMLAGNWKTPPDGGALLGRGRGDRRTRGCGAVPLRQTRGCGAVPLSEFGPAPLPRVAAPPGVIRPGAAAGPAEAAARRWAAAQAEFRALQAERGLA